MATNALKSVGLSDRISHPLLNCLVVNVKLQLQELLFQVNIKPADEPSGNLDQRTGEEVADLIFGLCEEQKQTLILVTHNEILAKNMIVFFDFRMEF